MGNYLGQQIYGDKLKIKLFSLSGPRSWVHASTSLTISLAFQHHPPLLAVQVKPSDPLQSSGQKTSGLRSDFAPSFHQICAGTQERFLRYLAPLETRRKTEERRAGNCPYSPSLSHSTSPSSVLRQQEKNVNSFAGHRKQSHDHPPLEQGNYLGFGILNHSKRMVPDQPLLNLFKIIFSTSKFSLYCGKS